MMSRIKRHYILVFLIFLSSSLIAQKFSYKFGEITSSDVDFKSYDKDTDAEAVVFFDIGKSKFVQEAGSGFSVLFERHCRMKILKESGLEYAEISIYFYQEGNIYETIEEIQAFTCNFEDGRLTKIPLDINNAYEEKVNQYWKVKKFAMPAVKEGSIIEYKYTIKSPYLFKLRDWEFQSRVPTIYSEYEAKLIPFYEYVYIIQGTSKLDVFEQYEDKGMPRHFGSPGAYGSNEYHDMVYKFGMKDIPAFKDETYITSINDYIIKLDFQLARFHRLDGVVIDILKTWKELNEDILKEDDFGKYMNSCERVAKKIVKENNLLSLDEQKRFEFIVNYTKEHFKWNGYYYKYAHINVNNFMKEKTGGSANINLFLTAFLTAAEMEAYPVLISTRDHGKIKSDYPFLHFFNSVVVLAKVEGKNVLTDGTDPLCPNNVIPPQCQNDNGLIVKKGTDEWVSLTRNEVSKTQKFFDVKFAEGEEDPECKVLMRYSLFDALSERKQFVDNTEKIKEYYTERGFEIIGDVKTQDFKNIEKPYTIEFQSKIPMQVIDDKIYISPFFNEAPGKNPFTFKERKYPIDVTYTQLKLFQSTITLPEGYYFSHIPAAYETKNDLVSISFTINKSAANVLTISGSYKFEKNAYDASGYTRLKFYFDKIVDLFNEKVIIEKEAVAN